ncbi:MAG: TolC family protein [Deltaproteobacteria bacterium]|nr:TolC family protein [Deltaproteobacteria bacterium]MBK8717639.1 TolC family protein [Deltaproteobacteria bacterium]MBP7285756.1 TolC family protein [Nannocystaceae bacterium]
MMRRGGLLTIACVLACASTKPERVRREVGDLVAARTGIDEGITPKQDAEARASVQRRIDEILREPLTVDGALRVALLGNASLQASLEQLGVAQAELVEAGLLENPMLSADLVNSTRGNGLGGGLALSTSLLSAFLIPAKRRLAKAKLRHAVMTVGQGTLALVRDVRVAFADVQAAEASATLHRELVQAAELANDLAQAQSEAGNLPDLDRERFAAALDDARLELADALLEVTVAREHCNRLMGLWGDRVQWRLAAELPAPPSGEAELATLEGRGVRDRLDVSSARAEVDAMLLALKLRRRGIVPQVEVGVTARNEVGNDPGHEWVLGPNVAIEIPIFDPGHADFAMLQARLRQSQHQLQHAAIVARSEIRELRERLLTARRKAEYFAAEVLPRRKAIVERALEQYNGMLIGTYELLETRSGQVEARHGYVEALRDYWAARAELELAVGGRLE